MKTIAYPLGSVSKLPQRPAWLGQELYPFRSRYFAHRGARLHYVDEGQGPAILFSHPAVGWSFMYREMVRILRRRFRCIAIDYPGFGLSGTPEGWPFTLQAQSEALEALADHLGLAEAIFLGHDTGGASAFALAARRPRLARGFILTDTIIFPVQDFPHINRFLAVLGSWPFRLLNEQLNLMMRITIHLGFAAKKLTAAEKQGYLQPAGTAERRRSVIRVLTALRREKTLMESITAAFSGQLRHKPALLICGENDKLVKLGVYQRIIDTLGQVEAHLVPGEEHFPHEGQAEWMARRIGEWMGMQWKCMEIQ